MNEPAHPSDRSVRTSPRWTVTVDGSPRTSTDQGTITWIGNATVLIEVLGLRILTDPNFLHAGQHAALGGGLRTRRLHDPARELEEVLPVDLVVLSHHHGDHWDAVADAGIPKDVPILTTDHAARKLRRSGFTRPLPLERWETARVVGGDGELLVTALPAKHAPQPLQAVLPPVNGSLLEVRRNGSSYRIYLTGDTLLHDQLAEIPRRIPGIDLAVVHLGGTKILGILLTMDGDQGARLLDLVDPDRAIPVHYEEYTVMKSPLRDFTEAVERRNVRTEIHTLDRGDSYTFVPTRSAP
jgi:L-ascorbate metabolism protein UlaG (beta-lactamase superfamily)